MYPHARVCVTADTVNAQHQSILDAFPFPVVSNAENMGIAYTKNVGIDQMMKGDYTHGFLMDDDLPAFGGCTQPCGKIYGRANYGVLHPLRTAHIAHDDSAHTKSDANFNFLIRFA